MSLEGASDASRRKLIEKALYSMPTSQLRTLLPDGTTIANSSALPKPASYDDSVPGFIGRRGSGQLVACRLSFPDLVVEKAKERAFVKELTDQLKVALSGIGDEALAATVIARESDEDPAVVQLSFSLSRAEQLKSLLETPALLSYTPLLKFAKFDSQFWAAKVGAASVSAGSPIPLPAEEVLARLDRMEKKYLDIRDKKNIVESYHEIMKRTNPYEARMQAVRELEETSASEPLVPRFPWSGVEGVLSPRAKQPPSEKGGYVNMVDPEDMGNGSVRTVPPDATVVVTKNALDSAIQQLSVDGVQLSAASSEISRRVEEALETAELTRIAAAGLVSPQVLEQLIVQSSLKREQQRQKDELKVLKAWERDTVCSVERENSMLYMQRLYALATGDDEAVAAIDAGDRKVMNPGELRQKKLELEAAAALAVAPANSSGSSKKQISVGVNLHVIRGSNLPQGSECFVRVRVLATEVQTATSSNGIWEEKIFFEYPRDSTAQLELLLFQYNSFGRDVLLARGNIPLKNVRDTDGQVGVWVLSGVVLPENTAPLQDASLSLRFDVESDDAQYAFSQFGGPDRSTGVKGSLFRHDLQTTQNLLRERNMDYIADQVERVEEERRRLEAKVAASRPMIFSENLQLEENSFFFPPSQPLFSSETRSNAAPPNLSSTLVDQTPPSYPVSGLKQVEKPYPTYEALHKELVNLVQQGGLGSQEGRQSAYDFCYIGQSKLDFATDPKLLDYLSLMSDVLVEYQADFPVLVTGLTAACTMLASVDSASKKRQISLVLFEAALRSLPLVDKDPLLADQVLTSLAMVLTHAAPLQTKEAQMIDFALMMWNKVREPLQVEQVMQILAFCKSGHRKHDQIRAICLALERFRFNAASVQRALTALGAVTAAPGSASSEEVGSVVKINKKDKNFTGNEIELVVVASGMYADSPGIQVAAVDALACLASASEAAAARIENLMAPVIFDQSLERNKKNPQVQQSVVRLILKLADLRLKEFSLPESVPVLFSIVSSSPDNSVETVLIALAAIRACLSRKDTLYNVTDTTASEFVSAMEKMITKDASVAREACVAIEACMAVPDVRETLIKAGVTAVPLKAVQIHASEYPRLLKQFLSSLHAVVLASSKAAFQFARLDGVKILIDLALFPAPEWRCLAILADACAVEETKKQFSPDDDIDRILALIDKQGRMGTGDSETAFQGVRVIGEIAFNSSFSSLELFGKVNDTVKVWFGGSGQINFSFQPVIWALLNRKMPQKAQSRFDRLTSPNGKDLTVPLSEALLKEFNIWVTAQGGAQAGASVTKTKTEREEVQQKGFLESMTDMLAGPPTGEKKGARS